MMMTLVSRSFFIWVLSSVLIHAMVIPVDLSAGDYSFLLDDPIVRANVPVDGGTVTVPSDYTQSYLATVLIDGDEVDVTAQYNALDVTAYITYDGDDTLSPGENFYVQFDIQNLYATVNTIDVSIETGFGEEIEDSDRVGQSDFERLSYRVNIPDNSPAGTFDVIYTISDLYGTIYGGTLQVSIEREESIIITSTSYDACSQNLEYTLENLGNGNVVDAIVRVEQDDTLFDYDFVSMGSGTGYAQYNGVIYADVTADFHLRLYNSDGSLADYAPVDYKACGIIQTYEPVETVIEPVVETVEYVAPSTTSVSSEFWDLTETQVAAYLILAMVAMITVWTLLFLIKYLLT